MRILFVEDHTTFAQTVIGEFLSGHMVELVGTVAESRELARANRYDVILVDFDLPDGKGADLITGLRLSGTLTPVVAVSSHPRGNAALLDAGANWVCSKSSFANIGSVVAAVRPLPGRESLRCPEPIALAAVVVERTPGLDRNAELAMASLFQSLLYGERQYWPAFMAGIVTHTECRNFLLAHANTLAEDLLGYSLDFVESTLKLTTAFEAALFLAQ